MCANAYCGPRTDLLSMAPMLSSGLAYTFPMILMCTSLFYNIVLSTTTYQVLSAQTFATGSAGSRAASGNTDPAATTPFVCVVTANSQTTWRNTIKKVWIPVASIATSVGGKNDPTKLAQQEQIIKQNGGTTDNTVRFSIRE